MDQKWSESPADALVRFLNALLTAREPRSIEELRLSVQSMGMDPDRLLVRAREQVIRAREATRLGWVARAQAMLPAIRQRLRERKVVVGLNRDQLIRRIRDAAQGVFGAPAQELAASFRKFENLPDKDLASLVEDIEALRLLEGNGIDES